MILNFFKFSKYHWPIIVSIIILFLLRLPSLFEPVWYVDEGIYAAIGSGILEGKELYLELWDHKPPGIYLLYAFIHLILPANYVLFGAKLINLLAGIITLLIFKYFLQNVLQIHKPRILFSALLLLTVLIGLPVLEGQNANAENFFLVFVGLALVGVHKIFSVIFSQAKQVEDFKLGKHSKIIILTGIAVFFASLIKFQPLLELGIILFSIFVSGFIIFIWQKLKQKKIGQDLMLISLILAGFAWLPHLISAGYFLLKGTFSEYLFTVWTYNLGYTGMELADTGALALPMPIKILIFFSLIGGMIFWGLHRFYKIGEWQRSLLIFWLVAAYIAVFLPNRFYAHYFLQILLPLMVNFVALFYDFQQKQITKLGGRILEWLNYFIVISVVLIVFVGGSIFLPESNSLKNQANDYYKYGYLHLFFSDFSDEWLNVFAPDSISNKQAIELIEKYPSDSIFIWGAAPWAYSTTNSANATRYLVDFHIYTEAIPPTIEDLIANKPKYILVDKSRLPFRVDEFRQILTDEYINIDENETYYIYQRLDSLAGTKYNS